MPYKNQCMRDAYTVVFVNCGTSVFAGIVVFSILGYREIQTGIDAAQVNRKFTTHDKKLRMCPNPMEFDLAVIKGFVVQYFYSQYNHMSANAAMICQEYYNSTT